MAGEQNREGDWFYLLLYWLQSGYTDMMQVFNNMSKKETLQVISSCVFEMSFLDHGTELMKDVSDMYKIAMTSLENRL